MRLGTLFCLAAAIIAGPVWAHGEGDAVFTVTYSNPQLVPSQWTLVFHADGTGHFESKHGSASRPADDDYIEPPDINRDVQLSAQFAQHVIQLAERKKLFQAGCESHLKVAFQGEKTLAYSGPAGEGSCEFNYSRDPDIQNLGDSLVSVANTLIEGARLQALLLHDRLGLDKETEMLVAAAADGRAQQIGSIRDILERLADDPTVLERVKRRARTLLRTNN